MFTIFHLILLVVAVATAVSGAIVGLKEFGIGGAVVGGVLGLAVGVVVGKLPFALPMAWLRWDLRRSSVEPLRRRLDEQYFLSHLILAELARRGEPMDNFREAVARQLASESPDAPS